MWWLLDVHGCFGAIPEFPLELSLTQGHRAGIPRHERPGYVVSPDRRVPTNQGQAE